MGNELKLSEFNQFRFEGFEVSVRSNKYYELNRISEDQNKIIVKVDPVHLIETRYGYALILDNKHVVFLKNWQVESNVYGTEVLLNKEYFKVKEWGEHELFFENEDNLKWEEWLGVAKSQQDAGNKVRWKK